MGWGWFMMSAMIAGWLAAGMRMILGRYIDCDAGLTLLRCAFLSNADRRYCILSSADLLHLRHFQYCTTICCSSDWCVFLQSSRLARLQTRIPVARHRHPATSITTMSQHGRRLEGKTAIITGAGLGLGEGIAKKFVEEGAKVLVFEIHEENGKRVADSLGEEKAAFFKGDVTRKEDWDEALKTVLEKFGGLDVVVNNAGVVHRAGVSGR
jgi:hypothetical protein